MVSLIVGLAATALANTVAVPAGAPHVYAPYSRYMQPLGNMSLSRKSVSFEGMKGRLSLQYLGEREANDLVGGSSKIQLFRVRNGERFLGMNSGKPGLCDGQPLRWLRVYPSGRSLVWTDFITGSADSPEPTIEDICAGGAWSGG
jgi:hypothetical protein